MNQEKREVIYKGRNNTIDLQFVSNSTVADLSLVNKIELIDTAGYFSTINSIVYPTMFDWSDSPNLGIILFSLGQLPNLIAGKYHTFKVYLYDDANTDGVYWGTFQTVVKE